MRVANSRMGGCDCVGRRPQQLSEFEAEAAASGSVSAALTEPGTAAHSIFVGVTTGVLVWSITNLLNNLLGGGKK